MPRESNKGRSGAERDDAYIEDIGHSATRIRQYVAGATFEAFCANDVLQDAVLRRLSVIGGAAACLSTTFKATMPDVPWKSVVGFRNLVVHRYWAVDLAIVWRILVDEIPALVDAVEAARTAPKRKR